MVKANRRVKCRRLGMAATLAIITLSAECPWFVQAQTEGKVPQTGAPKPVSGIGEPEVYWCPMRGLKGCGIKDYNRRGNCEVCKMLLVPRSSFLEEYKNELAATRNDWSLTNVGREEVYFCPSRGRQDHELKEYTAPGRCEICGQSLLHKARFEEVKAWTCLIDTCPYWKKTFFSPGRCPGCGEPVESLGPMDHNPVHGGILFMADNNYHRLEGTHPSPNEFRIYLYDGHKKPLDARNFSGRITTQEWNEEKKDYIEKNYPLVLQREGNHWLTSRIWAPTKYPVEIISRIRLAGDEKLFSFFFDGLTKEPKPGMETSVRPHKHRERPPVKIPAAAVDVVSEILKREGVIGSHIDAKRWFELPDPAFDTIDLANALRRKTEELAPLERKKLGENIVKIGFAADRLGRVCDASDQERVRRHFEELKKGLEELQEIFPQAAK
jgi:hypothetical protein